MSINRVNISGNLTRNAELRQAGTTSVLGFGVAVNDRRKNQQTSEWEDVPNFVDCTMFGTRAEKLAQYLTMGTKVCIEGRLRWSSWEKDGQKRSKLEVIVEELEFMSRRDAARQQGYAPQPQAQPSYMQQSQPQAYAAPQPQIAAQYAQQAVAAGMVYDEDIPF